MYKAFKKHRWFEDFLGERTLVEINLLSKETGERCNFSLYYHQLFPMHRAMAIAEPSA